VTSYGLSVFAQHAKMLTDSGIPPEHARDRGYVSVDTKTRLEGIGVTKAGRNTPGLLVPSLRKDGSVWGYQYRPDIPRLREGKPVKYETPTSQRNGIDVPPGVGPKLDDPKIPLWVTEGVKKADSAAVAGLCCVALPGVWSWRGSNDKGGKTAVPDWHDIALNDRRVVLAFDSDVVRKRSVRTALDALAGYLASKGARVEYLHLPDDDQAKAGLDDFLVDGHEPADLWRLVKPDPPAVVTTVTNPTPPTPAATPAPHVERRTLGQVHDTFRRWLGDDYDLDVLDAVLAVAASERLDGDPAWLLVVSGPGAAKTETVIALAGAGAHVTSTITGEGALLSATAIKERAKDATGGLLLKLGHRALLVIKDVTSILSMHRDSRAQVLAALREVYDGHWERNVGVDGGKSLSWRGRLVVIGAVTTKWDTAREVIAVMGDRFLLVRLDSKTGRDRSGRQALANSGDEKQMRVELAEAVAGVLAHVDTSVPATLAPHETDTLVGLADVVTMARTAVERDYKGDVTDAHAPEMPTRFAKQLAMLLKGAVALGIDRDRALTLATRVAVDTMPPIRLDVLLDVLDNPDSTAYAAHVRLDRPRTSTDQTLQALHALGMLTLDETQELHGIKPRTVWRYRIAGDVDTATLKLMGMLRNVTPHGLPGSKGPEESSQADGVLHTGGDISQHTPEAAPAACIACGAELTAEQMDRSILCPLCLGRARDAEATP
jgi:hypothetical protein